MILALVGLYLAVGAAWTTHVLQRPGAPEAPSRAVYVTGLVIFTVMWPVVAVGVLAGRLSRHDR